MKKIAFCICGSFCNHKKALSVLGELVTSGYDVTPIFSDIVCKTSTRFGSKEELEAEVRLICGKDVIKNIVEAEEKITNHGISCVVICPCSGNTLAKIANGINDTAVTMAVKCQLRNNNPVLIALATNDGLGASLQNIAACNIRKHLYFVPMAQDDPVGKPNSLICDFSKTAAFLAKIIATNDDLQ